LNGKNVGIFDCKKYPVRTFGGVKGKIGEVTDVGDKSFFVTAQGGRIEVLRARGEDGKKVSGGDFARAAGVSAGTLLGS
jgi:methionyl-tRNA formyltransferase